MIARRVASVTLGTMIAAACVCAVGACSDDDTPDPVGQPDTSAPDTSAADTSAPDTSTAQDTGAQDTGTADADTGTDSAASCGTAAQGQLFGIFPSGAATAGATVAYEGCAATTMAAGGPPATWSLQVSSASSYFRVTLAGFRTTLSAEIIAGVAGAAPIPLQLMGTTLTGYDAAKAHVLVSIGSASGSCTKDGNTIALPGHPEATVTYISGAGADVGAATNNDGLVWITGIVPGATPSATPTLTPGVAGCKLDMILSTGKVPLIVDTVAVLNTEIEP